MKTRFFSSLTTLRYFLANDVIEYKQYNLTISSMTKQYQRLFKVEVDNNNVTLLVNKSTPNLNYIFLDNKKIKNIKFKDFDASNITEMLRTFSGLELDGDLDLSNLNFEKVYSLNSTFSNSRINGNVILPKDFPSLIELRNTFANTEVKNIIMDINAPKLTEITRTFRGTKADDVVFKLNNSKPITINSLFRNAEIKNGINLKEIDFSRTKVLKHILFNTQSPIIDFGKNTTIEKKNKCDVVNVISSSEENENQKIRCTKEMAIFLKLI